MPKRAEYRAAPRSPPQRLPGARRAGHAVARVVLDVVRGAEPLDQRAGRSGPEPIQGFRHGADSVLPIGRQGVGENQQIESQLGGRAPPRARPRMRSKRGCRRSSLEHRGRIGVDRPHRHDPLPGEPAHPSRELVEAAEEPAALLGTDRPGDLFHQVPVALGDLPVPEGNLPGSDSSSRRRPRGRLCVSSEALRAPGAPAPVRAWRGRSGGPVRRRRPGSYSKRDSRQSNIAKSRRREWSSTRSERPSCVSCPPSRISRARLPPPVRESARKLVEHRSGEGRRCAGDGCRGGDGERAERRRRSSRPSSPGSCGPAPATRSGVPNGWFSSIHCRRSAKLKTSRRPRRCSDIEHGILCGERPAGPYNRGSEEKTRAGRPLPRRPAPGSRFFPLRRAGAGEFPFTRGLSPEEYRQRFWTMRQYAGYGSARESIAGTATCSHQGQTGLSIAFDLPTQMGYDSDDVLARGEVGKAGVAIATIEDMRILTEGLPLESRVRFDDDQRDGRDPARAAGSPSPGSAGSRGDADGHDPERPPQGVRRARARTSSRRALAQAHDRHLRVLRAARCRAGTRSRSPATTSARPARPRSRRSPSRSPTPSPTSRRRSRAGSRSTTSRPASPSSSMPTRTSSRRSRSSARPAGSGRRSRGTASARRIRVPGACGSTRRPPGSTLTAQQTDVNVVRVAFEALVRGSRRHAVAPHERVRRGARAADGEPRRGWPCARSR